MFRFHKKYFLLTLLLFLIEVLIALYVNDSFVRPYLGDFLVVILLYCFVMSFLALPVLVAAIGVLAFAFCIETAQYFQLVNLLRLQDNNIARTVIGQSFEWVDMLAYTLGILAVLLAENYLRKSREMNFVQKS